MHRRFPVSISVPIISEKLPLGRRGMGSALSEVCLLCSVRTGLCVGFVPGGDSRSRGFRGWDGDCNAVQDQLLDMLVSLGL